MVGCVLILLVNAVPTRPNQPTETLTKVQSIPPNPPRFSWDTLPVFIHTYDPLHNETTARYFARFPLVTMAGFAGQSDCCTVLNKTCCNEGRFPSFARAVATADSSPEGKKTRVLFYQNTLINFPQTLLSNIIPEKYLLHDSKGHSHIASGLLISVFARLPISRITSNC